MNYVFSCLALDIEMCCWHIWSIQYRDWVSVLYNTGKGFR